jgi:hypothetical protein
MNADTLIPVIALALFPLCAVYVVIRRSLLLRKLGALQLTFPRRSQLQFIGILACTPVLVLLNFFRHFDALTQFAISGTGLLGFYIALNDLLLVRIGGIYKNGVLWNAGVSFFGAISSYTRVDSHTIEVMDVSMTRKAFVFPDETAAASLFAHLETSVTPLQ